MTNSPSSPSLALLSSQVAHRLLGESTPSVSVLNVRAIARWTVAGLIGFDVVMFAVAILDPRTRW